jgi:hypothetical protein
MLRVRSTLPSQESNNRTRRDFRNTTLLLPTGFGQEPATAPGTTPDDSSVSIAPQQSTTLEGKGPNEQAVAQMQSSWPIDPNQRWRRGAGGDSLPELFLSAAN